MPLTPYFLIFLAAIGLVIMAWALRMAALRRKEAAGAGCEVWRREAEWHDVQGRLEQLGRVRAFLFSLWFWRRCRRLERLERQGAIERLIEELSRPVRLAWFQLPASIGCLEAQRLAAALGELGRYAAGQAVLQPWVERGEACPFAVPVQLLAADLALHAGDPAAAQAAAERALDWAADRRAWAHAYTLMAAAARQRGEWELALIDAERALEKEPGHPRALACQIACWSMLGRFDQAEGAAARALDGVTPSAGMADDPVEQAVFRLLWADVAQLRGEWARVVELLKPVAGGDELPRRPLALAVRARLAGALAMLGKPEEGARLLRQDGSSFRRFGLVRDLAVAQAMAWARVHARFGRVRELGLVLGEVDGQVRGPDERAFFFLESGELWEVAGQQSAAEGCYRRAAAFDEALWAVRRARARLGPARREGASS